MNKGWKRRHLLGFTIGYLIDRPHPERSTVHVDLRRRGWRYLRLRLERFKMGGGYTSRVANISTGRAS